MSFRFENFVAASSIKLLNLAKRMALLDITERSALTSFKPSMVKHEIKMV